jgi:predicted RNA binding protein YcfA (HicA-like mRNA interferase family)
MGQLTNKQINNKKKWYLCKLNNAMVKKVREMIRMIEADGWFFVKQKGAHKQYKHPTKKGKVTITDHGKNSDLEDRDVHSILKQAGI